MSEKTDKILQEIAIKHGIVLGKDDPILILQTMNDRLIEETRQAQAEMLAQFREEMESISSRWKDDAKEKAEKILNSALSGSKDMMNRLLQETTKENKFAMQKSISDSFIEAHSLVNRIQWLGWFVLIGSSTAVIGCALLISFVLTRL